MAREEKGKSMGSFDDMPPDEPTSLSARRAKLRGSLAKAALPEDLVSGGGPGLPKSGSRTTPGLDLGLDSEPQHEHEVEPNPPLKTPFQQLQRQTGTHQAQPMMPPPPPRAHSQEMPLESPPEPYSDQYTEASVQAPPPSLGVPEPIFQAGAALPDSVMAVLENIMDATNACSTKLDGMKAPADSGQSAINELLSNIDSAMNACALNLSALQKIADEQTEVLRNLSDTLKNQTLYEIGLNLNSLTESLSAALEPMKAVGELVPAIDQLVVAMEAKAAIDGKYSPDMLVMNLADQLSTGTIDPWTFKCAYMAIFPADHPADLLRRLVELLGTQRLSGDLFRAAYEAVQAADAPPRANAPARPAVAATTTSQDAGSTGGGAPAPSAAPALAPAPPPVVVDDPETKAQLESLRGNNEEMRRAMEERENEFEQLLAAKDMELQEAQDMLNSRYEEFNTRYAELTEALNKREQEYQDLLENKDMELTEKESELSLLRHQMEELSKETKEMVTELNSQMADIRIAKEAASQAPTVPSKPQATGSFFDSAPQAKPSSLFDAAPAAPVAPVAPEKPFFAAEPAAPPPPPAPVQQPQVLPQQPAMPPAPSPSQAATQAMPRVGVPGPQPTQPFASGAGSYGSGVRAQVFEVIVRQALAGAPWREICAGPMQVNNITPEEVEAEVKRRQALLNK